MDVYIGNIRHGFGLDTEGKYLSLNIFFAGCSKEPKCEGCHNPELWSKESGILMEISTLLEIIKSDTLVDALVFLGGEPLDQEQAVIESVKMANKRGLVTYLYTGKEIEEVSDTIKAWIDVIISGPYKPELANPEGVVPASKNQVITRN